MSIAAMKQALEALVDAHVRVEHKQDVKRREEAIAALRTAIEQAEWQDQNAAITRDAWQKIQDIEEEVRRKVYNLPPATPEQAEKQEPVAWMDVATGDYSRVCRLGWKALYTTPPHPQRQPLTDEQIAEITVGFYGSAIHHDDYAFARAIERAHGITGEKE